MGRRVRNPMILEDQVYNFVRKNPKSSFHTIQTALDLTSGGLQAVLRRLLRDSSRLQIYESSHISAKTQQVVRIFSTDPIDQKSLQKQHIHELVSKIQSGEIITLDSDVILPLRMNHRTTTILNHLIAHSAELYLQSGEQAEIIDTIGKLFQQAVQYYLKDVLDLPRYVQDHPDLQASLTATLPPTPQEDANDER